MTENTNRNKYGMTLAEISNLMSLPESTVRVIYHRAMKKIREHAHRCPTCGSVCFVDSSDEGTSNFVPVLPYDEQ